MIIGMHVHTRFSPCSVIRIRNLLARAREVGIEGVCITDHDTTASKHEFEKLSDNGQPLLPLPFSSLSSLTSFLPPIVLPIEDIF